MTRQFSFVLGFMLLASPALANSSITTTFAIVNLVSDQSGKAKNVDPNLINPWGLAQGPGSDPVWAADNGTGLSTDYAQGTGQLGSAVVTIPKGSPTGTAYAPSIGFQISENGRTADSKFIFDSAAGVISGWSSSVDAQNAVIAVDNSAAGAVYKGLAIATTPAGARLYATNFHGGAVDVFDAAFHHVPGGFVDATLPPGYAPFGIRNLGGTIYVTYALQNAERHDDVAGVGHGFVNAFTTQGQLLRRVASQARLNSPWGLAVAPSNFGAFSGNLLVGNFGDGHINAFDLGRFQETGELQQRGELHATTGQPLAIDGLWALDFGNGAAAGPTNALFFTAGPFGEQHGLFGRLMASP